MLTKKPNPCGPNRYYMYIPPFSGTRGTRLHKERGSYRRAGSGDGVRGKWLKKRKEKPGSCAVSTGTELRLPLIMMLLRCWGLGWIGVLGYRGYRAGRGGAPRGGADGCSLQQREYLSSCFNGSQAATALNPPRRSNPAKLPHTLPAVHLRGGEEACDVGERVARTARAQPTESLELTFVTNSALVPSQFSSHIETVVRETLSRARR